VAAPPGKVTVQDANAPKTNFFARFDNERLICHQRGVEQSPSASGLSRGECLELFRHFDRNQYGLLDKDELDLFAAELLARIPMLYKELLRRSRPNLSDKALSSMVQGELTQIMPGNREAVVAFLKKNLPFNYPTNKKIREEDFTARWNGAARHLFAGIKIDEGGDSGLACIIL